eukprot:4715849-Amphidinium_carterae.2
MLRWRANNFQESGHERGPQICAVVWLGCEELGLQSEGAKTYPAHTSGTSEPLCCEQQGGQRS